MTPEEKLLHAIFGRAGEDVKNDSLEVPAGSSGIVIGTSHFSRRMHLNDEQKARLKEEMTAYEEEMNDKAISLFKQMIGLMNDTQKRQLARCDSRHNPWSGLISQTTS